MDRMRVKNNNKQIVHCGAFNVTELYIEKKDVVRFLQYVQSGEPIVFFHGNYDGARCLARIKYVNTQTRPPLESYLIPVAYWSVNTILHDEWRPPIHVIVEQNRIKAYLGNSELRVHIWSMEEDYWLRNRGFAFAESLRGKAVDVIGAGSIGSSVVEKLLRLPLTIRQWDHDVFDVKNAIRFGFPVSLDDYIGSYKVDVIKDLAVKIGNPEATYKGYAKNIVEHFNEYQEVVNESPPYLALICTDTLDSRDYATLAYRDAGVPVIVVNVGDLANIGRIVFLSPIGPCWNCITGEDHMAIRASSKEYGINTQDPTQSWFGLLVHIQFPVNIAMTLTLHVLSGGDVKDYLGDTDGIFTCIQPEWIFERPLSIVKFRAPDSLRQGCPVCGERT